MGEVVDGPWGGRPVTQPAPRTREQWWRRDDHGRLWVWCAGELGRAEQWTLAPVPAAALAVPLPDRAPNPDRITAALDLRGLYGPEVDEALGVHNALDTTVDSWEAGTLVPSHDEVRRLATLTGMLAPWFYGGTLPEAEGVFMCGDRDLDAGAPAGSRLPVPDRESMERNRLPRPAPKGGPAPRGRRRARCPVCNDLPIDPPCIDCPTPR